MISLTCHEVFGRFAPKLPSVFPEKMAVVCRHTYRQPVAFRETEIAGCAEYQQAFGIRCVQIDIGMAAEWLNQHDLRLDEVVRTPRRQMLGTNAERDRSIRGQCSGNAIHLWYCKQIVVENNQVRGHRDGIYLEFVDDSRVRNNISENNLRYGLHFMFSNDDDYSHNIFRRNGAGVAVMFSRNINMWENRFEYNWGRASYGLLLKEIYDAEIRDNVFLENTIGIYVEGSTRIQYQHNEFNRNGWAIKMSGGCLDNTVTANNFLDNTFDLSLNSAPNNNSFDGNYWSEYNGYDLGRDGVGDVPYQPVKLFNYVVNRTPEAMVLLRSLFVDLLNFSEKVSPVLTPANVADKTPLMQKLNFQS